MQKNEIADAANDTLVTIKSEVLPEVACLKFSFSKKCRLSMQFHNDLANVQCTYTNTL